MVDRRQEQHLLSQILDGLDDLYDQRFGAPADRVRDTRAEIWLVRLLTAAGVALQGSTWESQLTDVAAEIQALLRSGLGGNDLSDGALDVTADLRHAIASDL